MIAVPVVALFRLVASAETEAPSENTTADELISPQFIAACVAAFAALVAAGLSWYSSHLLRKQSDQQREIDFRRMQLNELYGPLLMWRQASKRVRDLLPHKDENGNEWRLVDHIEEVRSGQHPDWEAAVDEILSISREIDKLLISKAGLFENIPAPESFGVFLAHSRLLQMYWNEGKNQPPEKRIPFPTKLDQDIDGAVKQIRARLEKLNSHSSKF